MAAEAISHKKDNWEDIRKSNFYFMKLKAIELLNTFFTFMHLGNSIVIYEIDYSNNDGEYDDDIYYNLWLSTFSCLCLLITLNYRYVVYLEWQKTKTYITKHETLITTGIYKNMILETILAAVGPQVFTHNFQYEEYNYDYDLYITYKLNNLLCCFVWIKVYACIRTFLLSNKFTEPRAQRLCKLNGTEADLIFSIRGEFKEKPNQTLIITFVVSAIICAYMLRIFER